MELNSKAGSIAITPSKTLDWHAVYRDLLPKVFNYFTYRVGDAHLAEDLAATTFERAWNKRNRYSSDLGAFEAWVFGIARRVAGEHFRKAKLELPLEAASGLAASGQVEDAAQARSDFARLGTLLAQLSDRDRELLSLKYGAGLNNRVIASLTRLSESNVGTILNRLVNKLRDQWEKTP